MNWTAPWSKAELDNQKKLNDKRNRKNEQTLKSLNAKLTPEEWRFLASHFETNRFSRGR